MFCYCLSLPFVLFQFFEHFSDFFASIFSPKSKFFMAENSFFLFSFSCFFFSCFLSFFLSSCFVKEIWWQKTKHVTKRNEWSQWWEWSTKSEKGGLLLACFSAWPKVWVDGPESTMENAMADDFWLGLAAIVCFLWLSDLCVTQTARGTSAGECLSSSPFVFSLSPLLFSSCLPHFLNTCQKVTGKIGQLEAVKLNLEDSMVCVEDQKKIVQETPKFGKRQLNGFEEETNKLADCVTAALVIYEEHMSDYHTKLILILHMAWAKNQSNDTKRKNLPNHCARPGCTLATFWNGNRFTERRWGVGWKEMMKCGIDGRARIKKRTRKEAKWKQRTRRDRSVMSRVGNFAHGPAHVQKKTVVVPQIQYIAVCDATTCSLNSECSETLEDDLQNAVQRWSGQCPCSDAVAFSHQKRWNLSPSESFVKNLIACVVKKMVLCGRKHRSMSSHLHYLLFSFTFFFL